MRSASRSDLLTAGLHPKRPGRRNRHPALGSFARSPSPAAYSQSSRLFPKETQAKFRGLRLPRRRHHHQQPDTFVLFDAELSHLGDGRRLARIVYQRLKVRRASLMVESRQCQPRRKTRSTNGSKAAAIWEQTKSACWPNVLTHKLLPLRAAALPE